MCHWLECLSRSFHRVSLPRENPILRTELLLATIPVSPPLAFLEGFWDSVLHNIIADSFSSHCSCFGPIQHGSSGTFLFGQKARLKFLFPKINLSPFFLSGALRRKCRRLPKRRWRDKRGWPKGESFFHENCSKSRMSLFLFSRMTEKGLRGSGVYFLRRIV